MTSHFCDYSSLSFQVEQIRLALSFHKGHLSLEKASQEDRLIFTPRLYTTEKFCASLCIDHLHNLV